MAKLNEPDLEKSEAFTDMMIDYVRDHQIDVATAICATEIYLGLLISELGARYIAKNVASSAAAIRKAADGMTELSVHAGKSTATH